MHQKERLLYYDWDKSVECFSTMIGAELPYFVIQPHQVHGDKIAIVRDPSATREDLVGYDALITNLKGLAIGVRTADCVPILLLDKKRKVIAAIHSGWKGTVLNIVGKTIRKMNAEYETNPTDIEAIIGPSIGMQAFQVGDEVISAFRLAGFPMSKISAKFGERSEDDIETGYHINLWDAIRHQLIEERVVVENIHTIGICTYYSKHWHSARREKNNKCDRIINSIKLL